MHKFGGNTKILLFNENKASIIHKLNRKEIYYLRFL